MTSAGGSERFRRGERLRSSKDFRRVSREGTRVASRSFVILLAEQPPRLATAPRRLGVTVSRKVGSSVVRNRVKRRIRTWYRLRRAGIPEGNDLVVIALPPAATLSALEMGQELDASIRRAGCPGRSR